MATTITGLDLEIIAQEGLDALMVAMTPVTAFSSVFTDRMLTKNSVVNVPVIGTISAAADFNSTTNNYGDTDTQAVTEAAVTLSEHKKKTFGLTDEQLAQLGTPNVSKITRAFGRKLGESVVIDLWNDILAATYSALSVSPIAVGAFDSDDVADMWQEFVDAGMNTDSMSLVLNSAYYAALLKDNDLKNFQNSNSAGVLRGADTGVLSGFDVYWSSVLPANGQNLVGFITDGSAMAVATGVLKPHEEQQRSGFFTTATDEATGLTLGVRGYYDQEVGEYKITYEIIYGKAAGQTGALLRLASA